METRSKPAHSTGNTARDIIERKCISSPLPAAVLSYADRARSTDSRMRGKQCIYRKSGKSASRKKCEATAATAARRFKGWDRRCKTFRIIHSVEKWLKRQNDRYESRHLFG